jgi:hypothetical protein
LGPGRRAPLLGAREARLSETDMQDPPTSSPGPEPPADDAPRSVAATDAAAARRRPGRRLLGVALKVLGSRLLFVALALAGIGYVVAPEVAVRRARDLAARCLAKTRAPRGPVLEDCSYLVRGFDYPTDHSYTRHDATYRAEELLARVAMDRYLDAAIGDPSSTRLVKGAASVRAAQELIEKGSRRISFEELGPAMGAPHLGKMASSLGDRATLMETPEYFGLWYIRRDVLDAATLEADFEVLDDIATRYLAWSPSDADLVTALGATLCITSPADGLPLLAKVPPGRAEKRYENMQRNYGEVFAALTACAAKLGQAPDLPTETHAGVADVPTVRRLAALRVASPGADRAAKVRDAIDALRASGGERLDKDQPYARAMLLAAVVTLSDGPLEPATLADMAIPRTGDGEGQLAPKAASLRTLLGRGPGLMPVVPAAWLTGAARALAEASRRASGAHVAALEGAAGALFTLAAIEHANDGRVLEAVEAAADGARWSGASERIEVLSTASAAYVAGDPRRALELLDATPKLAGDDADAEVALNVLEVLVAASAGQRARASELAGKLPQIARQTDDIDLASFARWTSIAFAPQALASELGEGPLEIRWTGQADPRAQYRARAARSFDATFGAWARALGRPGEERRAFRYHLFEERGDLPALMLPTLIAAANLLDPETDGEGAEIWLDALTALDSRRVRLRSYAFMRAEAARIRGDEASYLVWSERLDVLRQVAREEDDLELTRFLRF